MEFIMGEIYALRSIDPLKPATTLVLLPGFPTFDSFMDLYAVAEDIANKDDNSRVIQVLPFHPDATFTDVQSDAADFSSRSPVPMLHLLRDADVEMAEYEWAQRHAPDSPPGIQERNAAYLRGLGYDEVAQVVERASSR
uniref:Uncharacterized protein n=1 Tax=Octactis speculum TaxID=3111310 RepID=A0A7S2AY05_9STRA|mmetsp:Transcript_17154/g.23063  ORF Transcript_17154/g.23063 Transcript_17154/m.23063 type:complete len:139 (+) Transcript_17154:1-417(+)